MICLSIEMLHKTGDRWTSMQVLQQVFSSLQITLLITLDLIVYCDSYWGGCLMSRCFVTGYLVQLGQAPASWRTKKQATISRSSTEAKYGARAKATGEIVWLCNILHFLGANVSTVAMFNDNQAAFILLLIMYFMNVPTILKSIVISFWHIFSMMSLLLGMLPLPNNWLKFLLRHWENINFSTC